MDGIRQLILGLDIGGTKCAALVGNARGEILTRSEWPSLAERGPEKMMTDIIREGKRLLLHFPDIQGIGVSIGGPLDAERGIVHAPPHLPGWHAFPLKDRLNSVFGLPVHIEHDAAACALAEYLWGAGQGAECLAYLTCGTGFGVGFVFHGRVYHGARGFNCEIGHITVRPDGPVAFGKRGSTEAYCSGTALSLLAGWLFPKRWAAAPPSGQEITELAGQGDPDAREIIRLNAEATGDVCAFLADTLRLDRILLGSLGRYLDAAWLNIIRERFKSQVLPALAESCLITPAGLGARLQDCSALVPALEAD